MHLVGFIITGQHMHHQIDAKPIGHFALSAIACIAPNWEHLVALTIHRPSSGPVIPADDYGADAVVEIAKRHAGGLLNSLRRGFHPDGWHGVTAGKIL